MVKTIQELKNIIKKINSTENYEAYIKIYPNRTCEIRVIEKVININVRRNN